MAKSEQINELALALSKVQGAIEGAIKDSSNPFFKSKYADLTSCWEACRKQLHENGIAVIQGGDDTETHLCLTTTLMHSSGQWIDGTFKIERTITEPVRDDSPQKKVVAYRKRDMNAQEIGASITYLRRFSLCSLVGICPEDDDGNSIAQTAQRKEAHQNSYAHQFKMITAAQVLELELILKECSPEFVSHTNKYLADNKLALNQLDEKLFLTMKIEAMKNRNETQKKTANKEE